MLATVNRESRGARLEADATPRRETLDMARRSQYLALLRRWAQERMPAGRTAAHEAAEWIRDILSKAAGPDGGSARESGSFLVRLRARMLAEKRPQWNVVDRRSMPSSRVEQLIGRKHCADWEIALAALPRRQRELVILRVEFGLDYAEIAREIGSSIEQTRAETVNALAALINTLGCSDRGRAA